MTKREAEQEAIDRRILDGAVMPTFFRFAIPSVAGLLALTTATLVDGFFVGNFVGADALAAITLLIPYFTLLFGLALMLAIGGTVRAGKLLGAGDAGSASALFSKTLIATIVLSLAAMAITQAFPTMLFRILGAPEPLFQLMLSYFRIISLAMVFQLAGLVLYYFIRADGRPNLATTALVTGAMGNMILDALFVGYWGWGLAGAAWATGLAQVLQLGILAFYFTTGPRQLRFSFRQSHWGDLLRTALNGFSEFINEMSVGLIILLLNGLLIARQGIEGVAAFTVVNYLVFVSLMLFYGVADAMNLLVSQNYGAGNEKRINQFMRTAAGVIVGLSSLLLLALFLAQEMLIRLFLNDADQATLTLAIGFVAAIWPLFLVNGLNVLLSVYLTAMQKPLPSAMVALSRSLVLPALLLLAIAYWRPDWPLVVALPIAEWLTFFLALALFWRFSPASLVHLERRGVAAQSF